MTCSPSRRLRQPKIMSLRHSFSTSPCAMLRCMRPCFVLGHARYCQRTLGLDAFTDVSDERRELDPVVSQTLEFIADRHTISGIMTDLAEGRLFHEWCINAPSEIEPEPEVWRRRVAISALALMSKLWKTTSSQGFADFSLAYPHPYERMAWMICGLHEMSKEQARSDIDR
jgi:hypothetical protein